MKLLSRLTVLLLSAGFSPLAFAAVSIDSMNYPVWVERDGEISPLAPGDRLVVGDVVNTGRSGRAWLEVEEGSVIKLGEESRFVIRRAQFEEADEESTVLDAAFDVLRGAFRFTSNFFPQARKAGHRLNFQIGAVTAGVRGTDIWGRSAESEDFVALLEGSIEVSSDGDTPKTIDQPLTLYRKARGEPADPPQPVELAVVQGLAPETELAPAAGIATADGRFDLVLMSLQSSELAAAGIDRFEGAGFAVKRQTVEVGGNTYNRILLRGLVDRQAAQNLRTVIAEEFSIVDAWVLDNR